MGLPVRSTHHCDCWPPTVDRSAVEGPRRRWADRDARRDHGGASTRQRGELRAARRHSARRDHLADPAASLPGSDEPWVPGLKPGQGSRTANRCAGWVRPLTRRLSRPRRRRPEFPLGFGAGGPLGNASVRQAVGQARGPSSYEPGRTSMPARTPRERHEGKSEQVRLRIPIWRFFLAPRRGISRDRAGEDGRIGVARPVSDDHQLPHRPALDRAASATDRSGQSEAIARRVLTLVSTTSKRGSWIT